MSPENQTLEGAQHLAEDLQADILRETRLTCSAGVSVNTFLAKLVSGLHKPAGLTVIRPGEVDALLAALPVEAFFGVGPVPVPAGSVQVTGGADLNATTLDDLTPGTYAVHARSFTASGWTYVPTVVTPETTVQAGRTAGVTVTYVPQVTQPGVERDFTAPQVTLETGRLGEDRLLRGRATDAGGIAHVTVYLGSQVLGEAQWTVKGTGAWPGRRRRRGRTR